MHLIYHDPIFLQHDTGAHPECIGRLEAVYEHLNKMKLFDRFESKPCPSVELQVLQAIHSAEHIEHVRQFAEKGGGRIDSDTVVSPKSYEVALRATGTAVDAVHQIVSGPVNRQAVCLIRPPGHHALPRRSMGFCLFNHVAVAARFATTKLDMNRVLVVDWDVHHGNGTQDAFWEDEQVSFVSIHRWPFYPGSGSREETGSGKGLGTILNLPIEYGTTRKKYLSQFRSALEAFANKVKPELVLLSAGFDAHRLDPIGSLGLETEDYTTLTQIVLDVAKSHCSGRMISLLEGGYNREILPRCVEQHLKTLLAG